MAEEKLVFKIPKRRIIMPSKAAPKAVTPAEPAVPPPGGTPAPAAPATAGNNGATVLDAPVTPPVPAAGSASRWRTG